MARSKPVRRLRNFLKACKIDPKGMKERDLAREALRQLELDCPRDQFTSVSMVRKLRRSATHVLKTGDAKPGRKTDSVVREFYASYQWRRIRMEVLKLYERRCMCCGATPEDGVRIHVDHIKPLRFFWNLRLDINNLQVLCEVCNHGKGNWDRTDWRPSA